MEGLSDAVPQGSRGQNVGDLVLVCPSLAIRLRHLPPPSASRGRAGATHYHCGTPIVYSESGGGLWVFLDGYLDGCVYLCFREM